MIIEFRDKETGCNILLKLVTYLMINISDGTANVSIGHTWLFHMVPKRTVSRVTYVPFTNDTDSI